MTLPKKQDPRDAIEYLRRTFEEPYQGERELPNAKVIRALIAQLDAERERPRAWIREALDWIRDYVQKHKNMAAFYEPYPDHGPKAIRQLDELRALIAAGEALLGDGER
jgi:hypothetical protein